MTMTNKLGEILPTDEALSTEKCKKWWTDKVANGYFTNKVWAFSQPQLIDKFDLKGKTILEIGGGYGRETSQFAKLSDQVYVIDISQPSIDLIKGNVPSAIGKAYNGTDIPYEDNKFDFVYSCFVIQHMSKVDAKKLMTDVERVLKPGGHALINSLVEHMKLEIQMIITQVKKKVVCLITDILKKKYIKHLMRLISSLNGYILELLMNLNMVHLIITSYALEDNDMTLFLRDDDNNSYVDIVSYRNKLI